ncbi:MAG: hypothetical protein ABIJ80_02615 [Patescibacteria group bacterium]
MIYLIGGSMVFAKEMSNTKMQLEKMGYEVYINEQGSTSLIYGR